MVCSLVRSVADEAAVVASVCRIVLATLEPTDVTLVGDDSVTVAITLAVVVFTDSVPMLTVNFGAFELDVGCEGDVSSSVDAMVEEEVVEEVDDDDGGVGIGVVDGVVSVSNSSGFCDG